jgi:hypothetical protein
MVACTRGGRITQQHGPPRTCNLTLFLWIDRMSQRYCYLEISHIFANLASGEMSVYNHMVDHHEYNMRYYLANNMHHWWQTFVNTIKHAGVTSVVHLLLSDWWAFWHLSNINLITKTYMNFFMKMDWYMDNIVKYFGKKRNCTGYLLQNNRVSIIFQFCFTILWENWVTWIISSLMSLL